MWGPPPGGKPCPGCWPWCGIAAGRGAGSAHGGAGVMSCRVRSGRVASGRVRSGRGVSWRVASGRDVHSGGPGIGAMGGRTALNAGGGMRDCTVCWSGTGNGGGAQVGDGGRPEWSAGVAGCATSGACDAEGSWGGTAGGNDCISSRDWAGRGGAPEAGRSPSGAVAGCGTGIATGVGSRGGGVGSCGSSGWAPA